MPVCLYHYRPTESRRKKGIPSRFELTRNLRVIPNTSKGGKGQMTSSTKDSSKKGFDGVQKRGTKALWTERSNAIMNRTLQIHALNWDAQMDKTEWSQIEMDRIGPVWLARRSQRCMVRRVERGRGGRPPVLTGLYRFWIVQWIKQSPLAGDRTTMLGRTETRYSGESSGPT